VCGERWLCIFIAIQLNVRVEHYDLCNTVGKSIIFINQPRGEISNKMNYSICPRIRGGADKSSARPTPRSRRTESIVSLERESVHVQNCKSFLVTEAERKHVK